MENPIFLYGYDSLYPKNIEDKKKLGHPIDVKEMTLRCHNVRRTTDEEGNAESYGWEFQIVDDPHGDVWYSTSYDWSLVLNTEENLAQYEKWKQMQQDWIAARDLAAAEFKKVICPPQTTKV